MEAVVMTFVAHCTSGDINTKCCVIFLLNACILRAGYKPCNVDKFIHFLKEEIGIVCNFD